MNITTAYIAFCDDNDLPRYYVSRRQRMRNLLWLMWAAAVEWKRVANFERSQTAVTLHSDHWVAGARGMK